MVNLREIFFVYTAGREVIFFDNCGCKVGPFSHTQGGLQGLPGIAGFEVQGAGRQSAGPSCILLSAAGERPKTAG